MATKVSEELAQLHLNNSDKDETAEVSVNDNTLRSISLNNPVEDYKYNMEIEKELDNGYDENAYMTTFAQARAMVWRLLFAEPILSEENHKKAAQLLEAHKRDAVFYSPWDYNDWIPKVREELLKRKYFDFWHNVMVKHELGLCWARDSDYFHDMEDPKPMEFYKIDEKLSEE